MLEYQSLSLDAWGEANKPCQTCPSYDQEGNVTEPSTTVRKGWEDGVFMGTSCSSQVGPSLAFSFPLASKRDANDTWHWCVSLPQTSRAKSAEEV